MRSVLQAREDYFQQGSVPEDAWQTPGRLRQLHVNGQKDPSLVHVLAGWLINKARRWKLLTHLLNIC